jgi:hypothetical protein
MDGLINTWHPSDGAVYGIFVKSDFFGHILALTIMPGFPFCGWGISGSQC